MHFNSCCFSSKVTVASKGLWTLSLSLLWILSRFRVRWGLFSQMIFISYSPLESVSCSGVSNSCDLTDCSLPGSSVRWILQARILEWVYHFLLQGIFPTQGSNPGLLPCRQILYHLSYHRNPLLPFCMPVFFSRNWCWASMVEFPHPNFWGLKGTIGDQPLSWKNNLPLWSFWTLGVICVLCKKIVFISSFVLIK